MKNFNKILKLKAIIMLLMLAIFQNGFSQTYGAYTAAAGFTNIIAAPTGTCWNNSYFLGTTASPINTNYDGATVTGTFDNKYSNGTGADALIITCFHSTNYNVRLYLDDGTYTNTVNYPNTSASTGSNISVTYQNANTAPSACSTGAGTTTARFYYTPVDFASFTIPTGKYVKGVEVTLLTTGGLADLSKVVITQNAIAAPCNAGSTAPTLTAATNFSSNTYTIPCGSTTANLSALTASNLPATTSLTWHTGSTASNANKITATALTAGTYYAAFFDATNTCYSPTTAVTVTEANCITANAETFNTTSGTATTTAAVIANDTNNSAAVALGASGNSTLTWSPTALTGFTLNTDGTITVAASVAAGSYTFTYQICDKEVTANCKTATATVTVAAACTAGSTAPILMAYSPLEFDGNTYTIPCGSTTADLSVLTASNNPGTLPITIHNGATATDANKIAATALAAGTTYYAAFYDATGACYSPTTAVTVTEANCITTTDDNNFTGTMGIASTTASVIENDTNNGFQVTLGPTGNSTLTWLGSSSFGLIQNADGTITIPNTLSFSYPIFDVLAYKVCDKDVPTNCSDVTYARVYVSVPCNAGTVAPTLNAATNFASNTYTIPCGSTTADLSALTASNNSSTLPITIHSGATATDTNKITATALAAGTTYYAAFYDATGACYSPTTAVTVTEANCITANAETFNTTSGTATTTASVIANDTNNSAAVALGASGNSTLTWSPTALTGFTLNADGTIAVAASVAAGSYTFTYQICDKEVTANCKTATATVVVAAPCTAGSTAPTLNAATNFASNTYTIPCGSTTADLSALTASNNPGTLPITIHNGATATDGNKITATALTAGTYYAAFYDATGACYSPTTAVTVTEANCITTTADNFTGTVGITSTTASVIANDTNNGFQVTLGPTGNSTLTWIGTSSYLIQNADGTITIPNTLSTPLYTSMSYKVCDKDVPTNCSGATQVTVIVSAPAPCNAGTVAPVAN